MIITNSNESIIKYKEYIANHVTKVHNRFLTYGRELCDVCGADYDTVRNNISIHDNSKFSEQEFFAYTNKFYPNREYTEVEKKEVEKEFNLAWLHHIHNNPHHPEHWILTGTKSGIDEVFEMPPEFIVEMILDWDAFKKEDGTNGAYEYYFKNNNKKQGLLHPNTREILEKGLQVVK